MTFRISSDIIEERKIQDAEWGGPTNDDSNTPETWSEYIDKHNKRACTETGVRRRLALVRVAALAIAAIESIDRQVSKPKGEDE